MFAPPIVTAEAQKLVLTKIEWGEKTEPYQGWAMLAKKISTIIYGTRKQLI